LLVPASAWAYRPFVSTDAAVADPKEIEIELGYFNLDRTNRENTISTSHVVLNYGVAKNLELVTEFSLQVSPEVEVIDPNVSLKGVLKEGVLQDKPGVSVAVEAGPLLPSTLPREHRVGFEAIGIVSGKLALVTLHLNGGGGSRPDRAAIRYLGCHRRAAAPFEASARRRGQGESTQGERPNNSALLGLIWQPTAKNLSLDIGVRHGISRAAPDWQFTLGLTFGSSLPALSRQ
jgi:hypothetical protein